LSLKATGVEGEISGRKGRKFKKRFSKTSRNFLHPGKKFANLINGRRKV